MKKAITAALIAASMTLTACGEPINHNGKHYPTYGFLNESTAKSEDMCYEVSVGNTILSVITFSTLVIPAYFVGFSIFNPVGPKDKNGKCGLDARP